MIAVLRSGAFALRWNSTYQVDAEAVGVEPLLAHVARDHVVRFRLLAEAEKLGGIQRSHRNKSK